jgi:hypothetical protein
MTTEPLLAEDLVVLALDDEGGFGGVNGQRFDHALAGSLLLELFVHGKLELEGDKVHLLDASTTDDALLDRTLQRVASSSKPRDAKHWVKDFHGKLGKLRKTLLQRLHEQGAVSLERRKRLWVLPSNRYPLTDTARRAELRETVQRAARGDGSERDLLLLSMVDAADLTKRLFEKPERKQVAERAKLLREGEVVGEAVSATVKAANDAVTAAVIASAVVVTTSGGD